MIDPRSRWEKYGEKPDYMGLLTFSGLPYTEDPAELAGVDVAIVGAPMDELTSDRAGTRFGPRAIRAASCPPGPHLETGVDALRGGSLERGPSMARAQVVDPALADRPGTSGIAAAHSIAPMALTAPAPTVSMSARGPSLMTAKAVYCSAALIAFGVERGREPPLDTQYWLDHQRRDTRDDAGHHARAAQPQVARTGVQGRVVPVKSTCWSPRRR